ncbi:MAG: nucleotidyl transferase AbiEii/AbiGii toxin family protein [Propionibacteriaceae bacterium]|nr:nucleotidyl transferase AbiEii/AbiGii toxin family protein [Propionibacteriaceae bacterium]
MVDEIGYNLSQGVSALKPKDKTPNSAHVLDVWITKAERDLNSDGGRLGWLVASTIATAVLQQTLDGQDEPSFLLKGGTLLQHKLRAPTRTTTDIDGLIRGDIETFLESLDALLVQSWGPFEFKRSPIEVINVPTKVIQPRRFRLIITLSNKTWRGVQVELSPDEGLAGQAYERTAAPSLSGFGLPTPDFLASLAMQYQIAQKVHASTDLHDPPECVNDRARDVPDLLLLRDLANETGHPNNLSIKAAILDIFKARADEAEILELTPRLWPARLVAYPHWRESFEKAAQDAGLNNTLEDAVAQVNAWLDEIDPA